MESRTSQITLDSRVAGIRIYAINVLVGESCRQCIPSVL
ncbi:hypothetical protein T07_11743 [Trichinella nelsoni]|uniref:Uncharacterized protein n=1 Tax=Trichinella nelsoni TaxID=6336 RepID=A0A0V0RE15_9BILA|nr:hypothetical protein T07_11743 [Trichinella nelsoni]